MLDNLSPAESALWLAESAPELWPALLPQVGSRVPNSFDATAAFTRLHGEDQPHAGLTARLLLSHVRWRRVTGELVRRLEESAILDDADLDQMARELLAGPRWEVPVTGAQLALMGAAAVDDDDGQEVKVADDAEVSLDRPVEPPLRRWAAQRAVRRGLVPLANLVAASHHGLPARHRALLFAGILDAVDCLDAETADRLLTAGVDWPQKTVRDTTARLHAARRAPSNGDEPESPDALW